MPIRIAFQHLASGDWAAGDVFLEGMLRGLRALGPDAPAVVLVTEEHAARAAYLSLEPYVDEIVAAPSPVQWAAPRPYTSLRDHFAWWLRHRLAKLPVKPAPHPLADFLPKHGLDVYFTKVVPAPAPQTVPTVVWLPDFQHVHLPEMYSAEDRANRDRQFLAQARAAARVLVTADAVQHDLAAFAPSEAHKARCIDFVAAIPPAVYDADPRAGLAPYHLPERFVYLPNQFWQHKNHPLVIQALALLAARGLRPVVVCTGNPLDYRRPGYFSELVQHIARADVRDQFIFLGQVPRADVFRLMRQALLVLNPSRFEGLGMSVAESKSLGKRVLVSDLGPLRQQAAPGAVYFNPAEAGDLADKLATAWQNLPSGPDLALEAAARAALPGRQAAFGRALLQIFSEAITEFRADGAQHG